MSRPQKSRQSLYDPLDWLLVRAPLFPVERYPESGANEGAEVSDGRLAPEDPLARSALAVGGGDILEALAATSRRGAEKLPGKVLRYLIRMSTRPTPYGIFAGVALAHWGTSTDLSLAEPRLRTRTRLDMACLLGLVRSLEARPEVRRHLRYVTNSTAFVRAGRLFVSARPPSGEGFAQEPPTSVRATSAVLRALNACRMPRPHGQLVDDLLTTAGATPERVEALVDELWRSGVLLTDLAPPLTSGSPGRYVADRLAGIPEAADVVARLRATLDAMESWDALLPEAREAAYRGLVDRAASLAKGDVARTPLQVDMALVVEGRTVSREVAVEAARAAELLLRLTPLPHGLPYLDSYRRAFEGRYGLDREVRLLELLDPSFGLGPLRSHGHGGGSGLNPERSALRHETLRDLALDALRQRRRTIELDERTLERIETWSPSAETAPASLDVAVVVCARSRDALDAGDFSVVVGPNLGAASAGRNLGRFADLLGPEGEGALQRVAAAESAQEPESIRAEIVYLPPNFRSANVAIRPSVRGYEIPVATTPGLPPTHVVPVDELVVGLRDGRFIVRWPTRDVEVIACSSHMLNNLAAPDVCRFLEAVARDVGPQFSSFDWGPASGFPYLPRVQVGRVVLAPAQWRVGARLVADELAGGAVEEFATAFARWREQWDVPRRVYLAFGDNRLLLDIENPAHLEELREEVRRVDQVGELVLQEPLPDLDEAWLPGPGGRYVTEAVVPLVRVPVAAPVETKSPSRSAVPLPAEASIARVRPPGSDVLYIKLYTPRVIEEDVLAGPVREFCEYVRSAGFARDWFFIRYADPDPHLRVRFLGRPEDLVHRVLPDLCERAAELVAEGLCDRFAFDSYDRELERFGGPEGAAAAEGVFGADSRAAVELLALDLDGGLELDRTALSVLSIDDLLAGLGLDEDRRLAWYARRVLSRHESGAEYRRRSAALRALLGGAEADRGPEALRRILAARRRELEPLGRRIDALVQARQLGVDADELYRSFVHLLCNRLLAERHLEELVLGLLLRTREGLARAPVVPGGGAERGHGVVRSS